MYTGRDENRKEGRGRKEEMRIERRGRERKEGRGREKIFWPLTHKDIGSDQSEESESTRVATASL